LWDRIVWLPSGVGGAGRETGGDENERGGSDQAVLEAGGQRLVWWDASRQEVLGVGGRDGSENGEPEGASELLGGTDQPGGKAGGRCWYAGLRRGLDADEHEPDAEREDHERWEQVRGIGAVDGDSGDPEQGGAGDDRAGDDDWAGADRGNSRCEAIPAPLRADRRAAGRAALAEAARWCPVRLYLPMRPAVAEITGAGRAWTVSMISELSMPCR
jgi:hypothetical protein